MDKDLIALALVEVLKDLVDHDMAPPLNQDAALSVLRAVGSVDVHDTDLVLRVSEHLESLKAARGSSGRF